MPLFLCRWLNGDCSVVWARTKEDAIMELDEVANAEGCPISLRAYPAEPRLLHRVEVPAKKSLPGNRPACSFVDTRQGQRVCVEIRHLAGGYRDRSSRVSKMGGGFLLESPSIPGTTTVNDGITIARDTRGFAAD